ncbi:DNA-directed RNA polymerase core subunit rpc40 [Serendipita sp. 397]|nr:DNA-directed RNA polymerase core subunit rpc40 [Serendipita sp. 397]
MNYRTGDIDSRRLVNLYKEHISDVSSTNYPGVYPGQNYEWDLDDFKNVGGGKRLRECTNSLEQRQKNLKVDFQYATNEHVEFDLVGVDASIANALRRILIAEVPTMAIERVYIYNNTSVIQDEVLSHRLGLVPLYIDPRLMEDAPADYQTQSTDRNTVVFSLNIACSEREDAAPGETDPEKLYHNSNVYASDLEWVPQGEQVKLKEDPPRAVNPKILLAKLRPGQEIAMEMHAVKSIGRDHTKFSPVATATYRLMPHIQLLKPGDRYDESKRRVEKLEMANMEQAERFRDAFQEGVIEIKKERGKVFVRVKSPRRDNVTRRILELPEFDNMVRLGRVRDWFIYSVESTGQYPAVDLFHVSTNVLRQKVRNLKAEAERLQREWEGTRDRASVEPDNDVEMS